MTHEPDDDTTEAEARAVARALFAPEPNEAEPDESAEPDDDTRTARNLFA